MLIIAAFAVIFAIADNFFTVNGLNSLHIYVVGLASVFTAAVFVKWQKKEPSGSEKLFFALIVTAIMLVLSIVMSFMKSDEADIVSYIFSAKIYILIKIFSEFVIIYGTFHFYTKNAIKKQIKSDEAD
ncbi:MAG: hypothetical protein LBF13_01150 [Campylobacteraceae bacterium]|nr:hypothetical protein [Campylobacteraceae bacterium]